MIQRLINCRAVQFERAQWPGARVRERREVLAVAVEVGELPEVGDEDVVVARFVAEDLEFVSVVGDFRLQSRDARLGHFQLLLQCASRAFQFLLRHFRRGCSFCVCR